MLDDSSYNYLKRKLVKLIGINLDNYKSKQMRRRLDMFISNARFDSMVAYVAALEKDRELLQKLRNFLTINVSEFYRDGAPFEHLQTRILPELLKKSPSLNIWSAGCSRGEEAYSVAMILSAVSPLGRHRILATDIDEDSMHKARQGGPYHSSEVKSLPQRMIDRYLTRYEDGYTVVDKIKNRVEIKYLDLLDDEFENGFDLIICRNVTIYFTEETKRALNQKFYRSLKEGGILFIGGTEVMLDATTIGFGPAGPSFYRKEKSVPSPLFVVPDTNMVIKP